MAEPITITLSQYSLSTSGPDTPVPDPKYNGDLRNVEPEMAMAILRESIRYFGLHDCRHNALPLYDGSDRLIDSQASRSAREVFAAFFHMLSDWPQTTRRQQMNRWDAFEHAMREWRREDAAHVDRGVKVYSTAGDSIPFAIAPGAIVSKFQQIYFIGGDEGPIKIGISVAPEKRLAQLNTSSPVRLRILASRKGSGKDEWAYHEQFAAHRLNGEWFARCPDILAEIERLAA